MVHYIQDLPFTVSFEYEYFFLKIGLSELNFYTFKPKDNSTGLSFIKSNAKWPTYLYFKINILRLY